MLLLQAQGRAINLTEARGIDLLANVVVSDALTPNRKLYGELTNFGHILLALVHDPQNRFLESFGMMGNSAVSLRDPVFYRWHTFVHEIYREYKSTLPSYTVQQVRRGGAGQACSGVRAAARLA